jgi:steroid delta-isomerase-like uncharacterized protein
MSVSENKAIAQRVVDEGFNGKRLAVFDELVTPDFVNYDSANPQVTDLQSFKAWTESLWAAFPDLKVELTATVAEGDWVVHIWHTRGTQTGRYLGVPPTGKTIEYTGMSINTLAGGKIKRTEWAYNSLIVLQQLGLVPAAA